MDKVKSLLLNHGEKIVAAICALFGFMALSSASWKTDGRSPMEIQQKVDQAKVKINQNTWPEEDKKLFGDIDDVLDITSDKNKQLADASKFPLIGFNTPTNRLKEKRTQPEILAPFEPVVTALVFPLAMPPSDDEEEDDEEVDTADEKKDDGEKSEEEMMNELLEKRFGKGAGSSAAGENAMGESGAGGMMGAGMMGSGGMSRPGGMSGPGSPGGMTGPGGPGGMMGGPGGMMGGGGEGNYGGGGGGYGSGYGGGEDLYGQFGSGLVSKKKDVRVSAGASVRLVVDLRLQRQQIVNALHLSNANYQIAQQYIDYVDLQVERKRKIDADDPWSGNWEPVSSEDLGEILQESFGIDRDIVSPVITRSVITMPLPRRASGLWTPEEASHPMLEDFQLSREEKELFDKLNEKLKEKLAAAKKNQPTQVKKGGFSGFSSSAADMMSSMGGGYEGGFDTSEGSGMPGYGSGMGDMYNSMSGNGDELTDEQKGILDSTKATADNRFLLVRFMDFTVQRGYDYQYRVRLEMKNPNYNHPLDELEDPAIGAQPTLKSDWSPTTPVVQIPLGYNVYVADVKEDSKSFPENASVSVYTDETETGMPLMGNIKVLMGSLIAGQRTLEVVDLRTEVLEEKEVTIATDDLLAGAEAFGRLSSSDQPDLKGWFSNPDLLGDEITVIDSTGRIQLRSAGDSSSEEKFHRLAFKKIGEFYADWKQSTGATGDASFFGGGEGEGEGEGGYGSGGGGGYGSGAGMSPASSSGGGFYGGRGGSEGGSGSNRSSRRGR